MQVDVVILNWERPLHIRSVLIPSLLSSPEVRNVIISHGRRDTYFDYPDDRVVSLDHAELNETVGLALRFHCYPHVKTEAVLIIDDDQYFEPSHVSQFVAAYEGNPGHICGYDARYVFRTRKGLVYTRMRKIYKYLADSEFRRHFFGERPQPVITLTKSLIAPASAMRAFVEEEHLVEDFVRQNSRPLWNGEDIFFNLVHLARTGRKPVILKPCRRLKETKQASTGISSASGHYQYRSDLVRVAAAKLGLTF